MIEYLYVSLEMVEPVEETRAEVIFATEPLLSSLHLSVPGSRSSPLVELDEVEVRIIRTPHLNRSSPIYRYKRASYNCAKVYPSCIRLLVESTQILTWRAS